MEKSNKQELLKLKISVMWDVIKRYDHYIGTTNFKSALLTTINTTLFGTILLKNQDIVSGISNVPTQTIIQLLLILISIFTIVSIFFVFLASKPMTSKFDITDNQLKNRSILFFGDVTKHENALDYRDLVSRSSYTSLLNDLCSQAYELSHILNTKFIYLKYSTNIVLFGTLPSASFTAFILIFS